MSALNKDTWETCSNFGLQSPFVNPDNNINNNNNNKDLIDNLIRKQTLETVFCNDFICCEQYWTDLHELLQHCEECHCKAPLFDDDFDETLSEMDEDELDLLTPTSPFQSDSFLSSFPSSTPSPSSSPSSSSLPSPTSSFFPQNLSHIDLSMLENPNHLSSSQSSMKLSDLQQQEEYGYEKIKEWMVQAQFMHSISDDHDESDNSYKPYRCHVPGCDKTYKNANGLKYHKAHGHCQDKENGDIEDINQKPYICSLGNCKKRYKNLNGLKYHIQHTHFKRKLNSINNNSNSNTNSLLFPNLLSQ